MPRAKQEYLSEEMKPEVDLKIEAAAEDYVNKRDSRISLQEEENEAQATLLMLMTEKKIISYKFDGKLITIEEIKKAKVKKIED